MYASMFEAAGASILIENCHWGGTTPNATWCPWNYFRTSGDISANYGAVIGNLQTTVQWANSGLSQPGCWAYPDMLEVGVFFDPVHPGAGGLTLTEMKTHFFAWSIVSSPLILSHDVTNATIMDAVWPVIANKEALAVNQAWDGFSGSVFMAAQEQVFFKGSAGAVPAWQFWNKPVGGGKVAVLLMNHAATTATLSLPLAQVPNIAGSSWMVRDVWARKDIGVQSGTYNVTLNSHDAAFIMLTPQ
jgi:alpha-galactosidase